MRRAKGPSPALARQWIITLAVMGICLFQSLWVSETAAQSSENHKNHNSDDEIVPGKNLVVMGIPRIPKSLVKEVGKYSSAFGIPLAGWHPERTELLLKGVSSDAWITRLEAPGGAQKFWVYINETDVYDVYIQPQAKYLIYNKDNDGDEAYQMYLYDIENRKSTLLSDGKSRNTEFVWSRSGEQVVYSYTPPSGMGVSLAIINPLDPKSNRVLVQSTGNYIKAYDWSPDDRQIVFCEFYSNVASKLWLINIITNEKQLLSTQKENNEYYGYPKFSRDGRSVYVRTNRESEFKRLAKFDLKSKKFTYLTTGIKWDVDSYELSPDGKKLAFTTNEAGISCIYLLDTVTGYQKAISSLPIGVVSDLKWHNNSRDLAFNFKSPRTPNDVYVLNIETGLLQQWTKGLKGVDSEKLVIPELIHWKSFDGRTISGFLYRPPLHFTGKRPVIIDIHGGPEEQYRPEYGYSDNYLRSGHN